jgi:hypothetical protein
MSTKPPAGRAPAWTPFFRRFVNERSVDLQETLRLHEEVTTAWRSSMWSEPNVVEALTIHIFNKLHEWKPVPEPFHEPIRKIIREILKDERILFSSPSEEDIQELSLKEQVALRQFLRAQRRFLQHEEQTANLILEAILTALGCIVEALPESETGVSLLQVPLIDLLSAKPGDVIERVTSCFLMNDLHEAGLFANIRDTLYVNACRASGIPPYEESRKEIIPASKADLPPRELMHTYFAGTPFRDIFQQEVPFRIRRERFNEHGALFGRSGHGKTQSLRAIVAQFLQEPDPPALFLIDSLGSLIEGISELEVFNTTLRDRLVVLDPTNPRYMPRLNFFNLQSDDLCFYLFKALDQSFTARQATMISYLMEYMRMMPDPTLYKLVEVCESKTDLHPEVIKRLSPLARTFFQNQFFSKADSLVTGTKSQIAQRLYTLGRMPKFIDIFSAKQEFFDPYECMQSRRIVLINTAATPPDQGGLGEASGIFGRYILAQCLAAARRRPKHQRQLALLVVDECKAYMDQQAALILSDARQFGLGMLLASQFPHQLEEGVRREINTNTSIRMMAAVEYSVAAQYARDMFCEPEFITRMKSYDRSHAEWAAYVSGMDHAVKVEIPFGAIERMPKRVAPARLAPPSRTLKVEKRLRRHMEMIEPDPDEDLEQYPEEVEPEPDSQESSDWTHDEIMPAIEAGDWPEDKDTSDGEREKGAATSEPEIKPGKKWD